jgi:hypothetical protein
MIPQLKRTVRKSLRVGALALTLAAGVFADNARSDNVREYDENGLRYRETTRIVQRPVYETTLDAGHHAATVDANGVHSDYGI